MALFWSEADTAAAMDGAAAAAVIIMDGFAGEDITTVGIADATAGGANFKR